MLQNCTLALFVILSLIFTITTVPRTNASSINNSKQNYHELANSEDGECVTATTNDYICDNGQCHNKTTYTYDCIKFDYSSRSVNFTSKVEHCNMTDCRNTTRRTEIHASDIVNHCGTTTIKTDSCTNGACRNRTTTINACYSSAIVAGNTHCSAILGEEYDRIYQMGVNGFCVGNLSNFFAEVLGD